jgi:phosphoglycerol transferase MdoB-like AlkP superfamily enzyme
VLAQKGYYTALFHSGRFAYLGLEELLAGAGFALLEDAGHIGGNHNSSFGVDEPATVQRIFGWLDSLPRGSRFFVSYLPIAGHHPYVFQPPAPFAVHGDIDRYRNAIFDSDRALGVLLKGLRSRGLDSSTMVVVASDHGEAFGQHSGNFGHTLLLYEENVKVPLLFVTPGGGVALRVRKTASLLDLAPTVLDLLGLDAPDEFDGASLLYPEVNAALFFTDYSLGILGARDGCLKYIYEMESRRSRMFDICKDPEESNDISVQHQRLAGVYSGRLQRWVAAQVFRVRGGG